MKLKGWVAKDRNGHIRLYSESPKFLWESTWQINALTGWSFPLPQDSFPTLTWEDEPIEVEIEIKEVKK